MRSERFGTRRVLTNDMLTDAEKLAVLRSEAREALAFCDTFDDPYSPEAAHAYEAALGACERANAELLRQVEGTSASAALATPSDVELMALGYL